VLKKWKLNYYALFFSQPSPSTKPQANFQNFIYNPVHDIIIAIACHPYRYISLSTATPPDQYKSSRRQDDSTSDPKKGFQCKALVQLVALDVPVSNQVWCLALAACAHPTAVLHLRPPLHSDSSRQVELWRWTIFPDVGGHTWIC